MIIINSLLITLSIAGIAWLFILVGRLIIKLIIKRAIRKYISPYLNSKEFNYISYKFDNIYESENFKDKNSRGFSLIVGGRGSLNLPVYIMVEYKSANDIKTVIARINTIFFFIRNVTYNNEL